MRPWRKLHSSILESERFMDVSTEAKLLFMLLVTAQDDTGYFPWERMKIRRLVVACGWTEPQAKEHAEALVVGGMATWEEGGLVLRNGEALNGNPRVDRQPFIYQRFTTDGLVSVSDGQSHAKETDDRNRIKKQNKETEKEEDAATPLEITLPLWWETLKEDPRWGNDVDEGYIRDVDSYFGHLDLMFEARKCLEWLKGKGKGRKKIRQVWLNWVERSANDAKEKGESPNGRADSKAWIREHGLPKPREGVRSE